ncbi:hypothetical protein BZA05DRAFT_418134 [Tricharina praecox]|uniref:uncharacterized protein n=1 Tax=Tricharina praecox TaxID=43433 RepID=UPI0022201636|nr:uncharacterized protein BZA05DRAFT_418134 [Tricharina praecox]KAI5853318.1 hypothetical protein BZA05DRAFT_418134 [Tricharina praecox]
MAEDNALFRVVSHGRGGAGNIRETADAYKESESDLKIPTLKSAVYTTGRGGTGNMAINDPNHPENARIAQDVEGVPPVLSNDFHGGRGGAGNVVYLDDNESDANTIVEEAPFSESLESEKARLADGEVKRDYRGWADRGKDLLVMKLTGRGKKSTSS